MCIRKCVGHHINMHGPHRLVAVWVSWTQPLISDIAQRIYLELIANWYVQHLYSVYKWPSTDIARFVAVQGVSHRHLSDHLSDLTESTLSELEQSKIIAIDEDTDELEALNMAMISSYYYISYTTIELFQSSLTAKTKLKGLLEIISAASEFDDLPVRPGEEDSIERLLRHAKLAIAKPDYTDPHTKANALMQVCALLSASCIGCVCCLGFKPSHASDICLQPILHGAFNNALSHPAQLFAVLHLCALYNRLSTCACTCMQTQPGTLLQHMVYLLLCASCAIHHADNKCCLNALLGALACLLK